MINEKTIVQHPTKPASIPIIGGMLQRCTATSECSECRKKREGILQRAAVNNSPTHDVPPIVHEVLRSPGRPLNSASRLLMEARFNHNFSEVPVTAKSASISLANLTLGPANDRFEQEADRIATTILSASVGRQLCQPVAETTYDFSNVRIHIGDKAAESARAVNARAYTVGNHIVFGAGPFTSRTGPGQRLLAHELTHVTQQTKKLKPRLQRTMAQCQTLMTQTTPASLISGTAVHSLIQADFARTPGALSVMIPGASVTPLRTMGLCGEDSMVINPQGTGGRAGAGFPDLALRTPGGILQVAEIKPASMNCLVDGEEQLLRYIDQGNAPDAAQAAWRIAYGISVVAPMPESAYSPPG